MYAVPHARSVPAPVMAGVVITLIVEAFAIPMFLTGASASEPSWPWQLAAGCAAAAAVCAVGTMARSQTARRLLVVLASISAVLAALEILVLTLVIPIVPALILDPTWPPTGTMLVYGVAPLVFYATSLAAIVALSRPTARAWTGSLRASGPRTQKQGLAIDLIIVVASVVCLYIAIITAGLLALD